MVYEVTSKEDLDSKLAEAGSSLVVVDFFATWCGPCKRISPFLEELATKYGEKLVVLKVDVDVCEDLVATYKIQVMPTFVFMKQGKHLDTLAGSDESQLKMLVEKNL